MIICLCKNVSDKTIRNLCKNGVTTIRSLTNCSKLGSGCGKCLSLAQEILTEETGLFYKGNHDSQGQPRQQSRPQFFWS